MMGPQSFNNPHDFAEYQRDAARMRVVVDQCQYGQPLARELAEEIAQFAIKWKSRLKYGEYQKFIRAAGFNVKTVEKYVLNYRRHGKYSTAKGVA